MNIAQFFVLATMVVGALSLIVLLAVFCRNHSESIEIYQPLPTKEKNSDLPVSRVSDYLTLVNSCESQLHEREKIKF